ncbi:MAG: hypothetical protein ACI8WB_003478 [Phenylobacterium sp.]
MAWFILLLPLLAAPKFITWAKKRKSAAVALGVLVHLFLPDPNIERTIKAVVEVKQNVKKKQDESGNKSKSLS